MNECSNAAMDVERTIELPRTGDLPLVIEGRMLVDLSNAPDSAVIRSRWHRLRVVALAGGAFAVGIGFRSSYANKRGVIEPPDDQAMICDSFEAVRMWLSSIHDPTAALGGYPVGAQFVERQNRLKRNIRQRYLLLVSEVLRRTVAAA